MTVKTRPAELALMLTLDPVEANVWQTEDLAAILRDQLSQPLMLDLTPFEGMCEMDPDARDAAERGIHTFNDLLHASQPPVAMLQQTKVFAKMHASHPDRVLPRDVATVLYFASILVARRSDHHNITGLQDDAIERAIRWTLKQSWIDPRTRQIFVEGLKTVTRGLAQP